MVLEKKSMIKAKKTSPQTLDDFQCEEELEAPKNTGTNSAILNNNNRLINRNNLVGKTSISTGNQLNKPISRNPNPRIER